jgi:hypothetical protein
VEVSVVAGEMEDGIAENDVEECAGEGECEPKPLFKLWVSQLRVTITMLHPVALHFDFI